jgi:hypothetical protein
MPLYLFRPFLSLALRFITQRTTNTVITTIVTKLAARKSSMLQLTDGLFCSEVVSGVRDNEVTELLWLLQ